MKKIALIPIYNEEKTVITLIEQVIKYVDLLIVVNDGSTDSSKEKILEWMKVQKGVYFIHSDKNKGMSSAYRDGFYLIRHLLKTKVIEEEDVVITMDADGQHEAIYIQEGIKLMEKEGSELILARRDFSPYPKYKIIGNIGLTWHARLWAGFPYKDVESGYRLLKSRLIPQILLYFTGYKYSCAQEIGIISSLLKMRINNDFLVSIPTYVGGTKISDGIPNVLFGIIAFFRVKLKLKTNLDKGHKKVLGNKTIFYSDHFLSEDSQGKEE